MKINKILIFIITIITIMSMSVCYAASVSAPDAGADTIEGYVKNNSITSVPIRKLAACDSNSELDYIKKQQVASTVVDPTENPNAYKAGKTKSEKLQGKVGPILGAIRNVGVVVAVIILMVIGVKYILGSVEEKATYKQTLFPYFIGAIVIFAGSVLPQVIYNTMK